MFNLITQKFKNKGTKEEQDEHQYYILQWAEDLENTQTKQLDKQEVWIHFFMSVLWVCFWVFYEWRKVMTR